MTVHVVKRGETLSSIAKLYSTTIDRLASENSIKDANKISVGDSLTIPAQRQYNAPNATLKPADESKNPTTTSTFDLSQRVGDTIYQQLSIWHGVLDGSVKFDPDESRRAKLLLKDDLGFLNEDFYDTSTY